MSDHIVHAVLDTNTALHFKRADQIDWLALLQCTRVVTHITPVLARELEAQKVHNKLQKLRERAGATIRWLASLSKGKEQVEIRPGVQLLFIRRSPKIDYDAHHLRPDIADDEFIAHAIEYRNSNKVDVVIITNDFGLGLKAPAHDIPTIAPVADDRLADEPDENQQEVARLRKTLAPLQARSPQLVLTLRDGNKYTEATIDKIFLQAPPEGPHYYLPPGRRTEEQMQIAKKGQFTSKRSTHSTTSAVHSFRSGLRSRTGETRRPQTFTST